MTTTTGRDLLHESAVVEVYGLFRTLATMPIPAEGVVVMIHVGTTNLQAVVERDGMIQLHALVLGASSGDLAAGLNERIGLEAFRRCTHREGATCVRGSIERERLLAFAPTGLSEGHEPWWASAIGGAAAALTLLAIFALFSLLDAGLHEFARWWVAR